MAKGIYQDDNNEGRRGPKNKHRPVPHLPRRRVVDYRGTDHSNRSTHHSTSKLSKQEIGDRKAAESNEIQNQAEQYASHTLSPAQVPIESNRESERSTQNRFGELPKVVAEKTRQTQGRQGIREYVPLHPFPLFPYPYPTISNEQLLRAYAELLAQSVTFRPRDPRGRRCDHRYWIVGETSDKTDLLALRIRKPDGNLLKPSFAIREIFANPKLWNFDCAEFVQVVLLNTLREMIGDEKFDSLPRDHDGAFRIRRHWSTFLKGSAIKLAWNINDDGKFIRIRGYNKYETETKTPEEILSNAPIGSLVNFRNYDPKIRSKPGKENPFETENVIKIGQDEFIALGFGDERPYYTSQQIMTALAKDGNHGKKIPKDYIKNFIRISGVVPFALPD